MEYLVGIDKPKGPTSHDVIDEVRRVSRIRKVGHAGTLDPLARGVLVVGIGKKATKKLGELSRKDKEYVATINLGAFSSTDDAEGELTEVSMTNPSERTELEKVLKSMEGLITQTPPQYSAVKYKGKPAYRYARKNVVVPLKPRVVEIFSIDLMNYTWPTVTIRVVSGSGVYIRTLARDIGRGLNAGGYLTDLVRIRVGAFTIAEAIPLKTFPEWWRRITTI